MKNNFKHLDEEIDNAVSSTDFTGLIPANSDNGDIDSYKKVYEFGNDLTKK